MQLPTLRLQKSTSYSPPPNREEAKVVGGGVRLWLMDESYKALHVDVDHTTVSHASPYVRTPLMASAAVEALWHTACDKLGLAPESSECFYIYGCGNELELLLIGEETVGDVMRNWIATEHKYFPWVTFPGFEGGQAVSAPSDKEAAADRAAADAREKDARAKLSRSSKLGESLSRTVSSTRPADKVVNPQDSALGKSGSVNNSATVRVSERPSPVRFFFKTTEICPLDMRRRAMSDTVAKRLFYVEAVYYVLKSWYPVTKEQAIALGGLQLQAYVGDAGAVHTPGFLANDNNWKNYVPKHLRHTMPIQQWEVALLAEHTKHRGKKADHCMTEYLQIVFELPVYGCAFYNVKRTKSGTAFFSHEFDSNVIIGLNEHGLHVIDAFSMKIESFPHGIIKDWKISGKFLNVYLSRGEDKKLKFKTKQSDLLNDLLGAWQSEWRGSHRSVRLSQRKPAAPHQNGEAPSL